MFFFSKTKCSTLFYADICNNHPQPCHFIFNGMKSILIISLNSVYFDIKNYKISSLSSCFYDGDLFNCILIPVLSFLMNSDFHELSTCVGLYLKAVDWVAEKWEYHCSAVFLFFPFLLSLELQPIGWCYTQGGSSIKFSGDFLTW